MPELYHQAPQKFLGLLLIDTNPMAASVVEQAEWPSFGAQAENEGVPSIVPIVEPEMLTRTGRMAARRWRRRWRTSCRRAR